MTNEEAAKKMHWQKIEWLEIINNGQDGVVEAYDKAIKALESKSEAEEYRAPKKPVHFKYTDGSVDDVCPTCCCVLIPHFTSFCSNCGQALDWN